MSTQQVRALWKDGKTAEALVEAWRAYDAAPHGNDEKYYVARLLREDPELFTADRVDNLRTLLSDPKIDPSTISGAGWRHLLRDTDLFAPGRDAAAMAAEFETNALVLTLLTEDCVAAHRAETALTQVRRWLLLEDRWRDFPKLSEALAAQAALNEGAWLFDAEERARLAEAPQAIRRAYLPDRPGPAEAGAFDHAVTRAVAAQYEGWPYPAWRRVLAAPPSSLAKDVRGRDPDGPDTIPTPADILIAGCGTGRQTAMIALRYPKDHLTSIDISEASLAYARERCAASGLSGIEFRILDLHAVETLGRQFDAILCTGVLHHLPDPEAGWEALNRVLRPGGVMHVMVYSRVARMRIMAWRKALGDLTRRTVDDDLLREIRGRLMALPQSAIPKNRDFQTLAGVHDLLMHRHEDPFDIPRIRRALERMGLELIQFELPTAKIRAAYRANHPDDPLRRDYAGWTEMERKDPSMFAAMYDLWCRKPLA